MFGLMVLWTCYIRVVVRLNSDVMVSSKRATVQDFTSWFCDGFVAALCYIHASAAMRVFGGFMMFGGLITAWWFNTNNRHQAE